MINYFYTTINEDSIIIDRRMLRKIVSVEKKVIDPLEFKEEILYQYDNTYWLLQIRDEKYKGINDQMGYDTYKMSHLDFGQAVRWIIKNNLENIFEEKFKNKLDDYSIYQLKDYVEKINGDNKECIKN